jgi:putative membrane protein
MHATIKVAILGMGACLFVSAARAADPPSTADVLDKLHKSNLTEIEAGKLAQDNGHSKATKDYGKMLVSDHTSADSQVKALAKEEKIDLSVGTPVVGSNSLADLTADDHKKAIAEATAARDTTTDAKLKALLTGMLPTLEKHESMAESLKKHRKE